MGAGAPHEAMAPGPPTILCIDDDPLLLQLCRELLEADGYRVRTAPDGQAGLEVAQQARPDLILLDVVMPGMDGLEVCRSLRADPRLGGIPVILLTAYHTPNPAVHGLFAGATHTMRKPVRPETLLQSIAIILRATPRGGER